MRRNGGRGKSKQDSEDTEKRPEAPNPGPILSTEKLLIARTDGGESSKGEKRREREEKWGNTEKK